MRLSVKLAHGTCAVTFQLSVVLESLRWSYWELGFASHVFAFGYDKVRRIETARLFGNVSDTEYYYLDLLVGAPYRQRVSAVADTGSNICVFTCKGCSQCGSHLDPPFDFSASDTAQWLACKKKYECHSCMRGTCNFAHSPIQGSSVSGSLFTELVSMGDEFQANPPIRGFLGCNRRETKLFFARRANGIFGMAPGSSARPTILEEIFGDTAHVNTQLFAMCLSRNGGLLNIGGYNGSLHVRLEGGLGENFWHPSHTDSSIFWIPMVVGPSYQIDLELMWVEASPVRTEPFTPEEVGRTGFGLTSVNSGSAYTYLPRVVYSNLHAIIHMYCKDQQKCRAEEISRTCWQIPSPTYLQYFPSIKMRFTGVDAVWTWRPQSYMFQQAGSSNTYCYGFESNGNVAETVLGATWMLNSNVIFDISSKRLGLAVAKCPEFLARPSDSVVDAYVEGVVSSLPDSAMVDSGSTMVIGLLEWSIVAIVCLGVAAVVYYLRAAQQRFEGLIEIGSSKSQREVRRSNRRRTSADSRTSVDSRRASEDSRGSASRSRTGADSRRSSSNSAASRPSADSRPRTSIDSHPSIGSRQSADSRPRSSIDARSRSSVDNDAENKPIATGPNDKTSRRLGTRCEDPATSRTEKLSPALLPPPPRSDSVVSVGSPEVLRQNALTFENKMHEFLEKSMSDSESSEDSSGSIASLHGQSGQSGSRDSPSYVVSLPAPVTVYGHQLHEDGGSDEENEAGATSPAALLRGRLRESNVACKALPAHHQGTEQPPREDSYLLDAPP